MRYDGAILMSRTQIRFEPEMHLRARQGANVLGISLAEYVRRLVADDLGGAKAASDPTGVFDLGSSGGSEIAKKKRAMIAEALAGTPRKRDRA